MILVMISFVHLYKSTAGKTTDKSFFKATKITASAWHLIGGSASNRLNHLVKLKSKDIGDLQTWEPLLYCVTKESF